MSMFQLFFNAVNNAFLATVAALLDGWTTTLGQGMTFIFGGPIKLPCWFDYDAGYGSGTGSESVLDALTRVLDWLDIANNFIPLYEILCVILGLVVLKMSIVIVRWIKAWIPTVSGV
ncbi:MAG: hypothetical protein JSS27_18870 [Planctomycetes bacterium]|nr:hypothetical protein [Planctomycetota bacterium]